MSQSPLSSFSAPNIPSGSTGTLSTADKAFVVSGELIQTNMILGHEFTAGQKAPGIDTIVSAGSGTPTQLYKNSLVVSFATVQNISTADLTLAIDNPNVAAGVGSILNAASAAGKGGGSIDMHNVDLTHVWFIVAATGNVISVYREV